MASHVLGVIVKKTFIFPFDATLQVRLRMHTHTETNNKMNTHTHTHSHRAPHYTQPTKEALVPLLFGMPIFRGNLVIFHQPSGLKKEIIFYVNTQHGLTALQPRHNPKMNSTSPPTQPKGNNVALEGKLNKVCQVPTQPIMCRTSVEKDILQHWKKTPWGTDNIGQDTPKAPVMPTTCTEALKMHPMPILMVIHGRDAALSCKV